MAKVTGVNNTLSLAQALIEVSGQAGSTVTDYAEGILDIAEQLSTDGTYSEGEDTYTLASASPNSVKFTFKDGFDGPSSKSSTSQTLTINGKNLDQAEDSSPATEVTGISFSDKNSFQGTEGTSQYSEEETVSGNASVRYQPFSNLLPGLSQSIDLFSISEKYSYKSSDSYMEGSEKFTSKSSEKSAFGFKGDLNYNNGNLNGSINSLSYSETREGQEGSSKGKQSVSFEASSKNGFDIEDGLASGTLDKLSFGAEFESSGRLQKSLSQSSEFSYEGSNIDAGVLTGEDTLTVASKLFASDDSITGTSFADSILGFAGRDTYSWDAKNGGEDTVNLSRLGTQLNLGGTEEIDTVNVTGAGKTDQIRVSFVSAEIGNGIVYDSNDDGAGNEFGNEDGGLAVRLQLENTSGTPSGTVGRFDDEGMLFTTKSGSFDVRDLNAGTQRGDQFKTVFLGTIGSDTQVGGKTADYLNAGQGNDFLDGGAGNDFLVGGGGNDRLTGGKGNDSFIGGAGNDFFIINKGDSGLKVVNGALQADTIISFDSATDTLEFDVKVGGYFENSVANTSYEGALAMANGYFSSSKTADKSALFSFQFTQVGEVTTGYLFEDYTGDGKADQVIVLTGINANGFAGTDVLGLLGTTGEPLNQA